jgi:hypothetical protein
VIQALLASDTTSIGVLDKISKGYGVVFWHAYFLLLGFFEASRKGCSEEVDLVANELLMYVKWSTVRPNVDFDHVRRFKIPKHI